MFKSQKLAFMPAVKSFLCEDCLLIMLLLDRQQINALNTELVSVRLQRQYVEQYKKAQAFVCLSDGDKHNLIKFLAPIVYMDDTDEEAKRFDNLMYGMMIAQIEGMPQFNKGKKQLIKLCQALSERVTIQQIKEKLVLINSIDTDEFWESSDLLILSHLTKDKSCL